MDTKSAEEAVMLFARRLDARHVSASERYLGEKLVGKVLREAQLQPPSQAALTGAAPTVQADISHTLQERGSRYGEFTTHASITQALKGVMRGTANWAQLAPDQQEALEMIAHKVGRILNGDPNYHDSWHDIVGYTKLVADRLAGKVQ